VRARFVDHLSKADQNALAEIFERVSDSLRKDLKDK